MTKKETVQERLARLQREKEEAAKNEAENKTGLVSQLHHENDGEPDFSELAKKLEERQKKEKKGENSNHVKMTIYIEAETAAAFNALITKRGDQKAFANQAIKDFVLKKSRELGF